MSTLCAMNELMQCNKIPLLDQLVGREQQLRRDCQAERPGRLYWLERIDALRHRDAKSAGRCVCRAGVVQPKLDRKPLG